MVLLKNKVMKANKVPEKIYIDDFGSELSHDWHTEHCCESDIEYTRTDAFIEKAVNFMEMLGYGFTITDNITHTNYGKEQLVEDFRKYMKGE